MNEIIDFSGVDRCGELAIGILLNCQLTAIAALHNEFECMQGFL